MNIPNCPYCDKKMMVGRVDLGGGSCPWAVIHENEEDGEACGYVFGYFRNSEQANIFAKKLAYYAEEY